MAKSSSSKGSKKGRRFNRPRSAQAIARCAFRKKLRIAIQADACANNISDGSTPWQLVKAKRAAARK